MLAAAGARAERPAPRALLPAPRVAAPRRDVRRLGAVNATAPTDALLEVRDLHVSFPVRGSKLPLRAVNGVSLEIAAGTTFGLIGESGSGKSTVARAITRLGPI